MKIKETLGVSEIRHLALNLIRAVTLLKERSDVKQDIVTDFEIGVNLELAQYQQEP